MKTLVKSLLTIVMTVALVGLTTAAYFTANVSATGNTITTGTLKSSVDSENGSTGYVVAYADAAGNHLVSPFTAITNWAPGETRDVYLAVRNWGTIPFKYQAAITGSWGNSTLDNQNMVTVSNVKRYASVDCDGAETGCMNIYNWEPLNGATWQTGLAKVEQSGPVTGWYSPATSNVVDPNRYSVHKVSVTLNPFAGNDFQEQTFTYTLNLQTTQLADTAFATL